LTAQRPPELTEEEKRFIGLLAEGYSEKHIEYRLGKPGLDVNRIALQLWEVRGEEQGRVDPAGQGHGDPCARRYSLNPRPWQPA
jgi:transposase